MAGTVRLRRAYLRAGIYIPVQMSQSRIYETTRLPGLRLDVAVLWQEKLPGYFEIGQAVQQMIKDQAG